MRCYDEHMSRVGILCGHMGSYCPDYGVTTVGAARPSDHGNESITRKRTSTYDLDENDSDPLEDIGIDDVNALREVESDSDDYGGSPTGGPKKKSMTGTLEKDEISIVPTDHSDEGDQCCGINKTKLGSVKGVEKNAGTVNDFSKGNRNDAASGRGKRSMQSAGTLPGFEKFVEVIGHSTKAQNDREERRMYMEQEKRGEERLFRRLEAAQKLVKDNPGNSLYEMMLERLARKAFGEDSD